MKLVDLFDNFLIQDSFILCCWHDDTFDLIKFERHIDYCYGYPIQYSCSLKSYLKSKVIYLISDPDSNLLKVGVEF